jgi:hypothetical protein
MLEDVRKESDGLQGTILLGNLLYYYNQKDEAIAAGIRRQRLLPDMEWFTVTWLRDRQIFERCWSTDFYRKAVAVDSTDPKFFTELDILEEALKVPSAQRLARMEKNTKTIFKSDDATSRYVYLLVDNGKYDQALSILDTRHFRVWEGGQTVYTQFVDAHLLNGLKLMVRKQYK